jgi:hypothetical protein
MKIRHIAAALLATATTAALSVGIMSPSSAAARVVHPQVAPGAVLTKATIEFFTTSDDKDFDTFVATRVTDGASGRLVARAQSFYTHFNDHTDDGPFPLTVRTSETADDLNFGNINVTITPNGNDTWNFFYVLELTFSDGSIEDVDSPPLHLTQDSRSNDTDLVF